MAKEPLSEQLRSAVLNCGVSRYRIAKDTGLTEAQLCRFVSGQIDIKLSTVDRICEYIGARLVLDEIPARRKRKR